MSVAGSAVVSGASEIQDSRFYAGFAAQRPLPHFQRFSVSACQLFICWQAKRPEFPGSTPNAFGVGSASLAEQACSFGGRRAGRPRFWKFVLGDTQHPRGGTPCSPIRVICVIRGKAAGEAIGDSVPGYNGSREPVVIVLVLERLRDLVRDAMRERLWPWRGRRVCAERARSGCAVPG